MQKAIREHIVARFRIPKVVTTDNGVQLISQAFKKFLSDIGIKQQLSAPYTAQENRTERANRTVKTMIQQFTGQN